MRKRYVTTALALALATSAAGQPISGAVARRWAACAVTVTETGGKVVIGVELVPSGAARAVVVEGEGRAADLARAIVQAEINAGAEVRAADTFTFIIGG